MKDFTVMLIGDETTPVRRYHIPGRSSQWAIAGVSVAALLLFAGMWDYWRVRAGHAELASLRVEAAEQREQIRVFESTLREMEGELAQVKELERKVRIIANLPGAAAAGGGAVTDLAPAAPASAGSDGDAEILMVPVGVPVDLTQPPQIPDPIPLGSAERVPEVEPAPGLSSVGARHVVGLRHVASDLERAADQRQSSLLELVSQLEDKRSKLASMPSIWPARGWLTSRFGYRISPFTGKRQRHAGIDIAARPGTVVIAPAKGRVQFVGRKGPLGNAVVLDHGFGVRTVYGHNSALLVKIGDEVVRGQAIAELGSSGRSTGPHLHYVVEVNGRPRDPLNYIFD